MRRVLLGVAIASLWGRNSVSPVKVQGGEVCYRCRRVIQDTDRAAANAEAYSRGVKPVDWTGVMKSARGKVKSQSQKLESSNAFQLLTSNF
jgi:hypothetical protein